eukprot:301165_1
MEDTLPFERTKLINKSVQNTVFGYLRNCQSLLPSNLTYYQIPENIQLTILLFYYQQIESEILSKKECYKLLSLFETQNKFTELNNYSYELIYSSTTHETKEEIFKNTCHNKPNLLCLVETKDNNVFGGYTSKGWIGFTDDDQTDDKAFIFLIRSSKNYKPMIFNIKKAHIDKAIRVQSGWYCMFGCGHYEIFINGSSFIGGARSNTLVFDNYPHDRYLSMDGYPPLRQLEVFQLH